MKRTLFRPLYPALAVSVLLAAVAGCRTERTLLITSEPPGAEVRLDGEAIGATPVQHEFLYYGKRRVTLRCDGHCTHSEEVELKGPWYGRFPFDIVSEVLIPIGWKDRRHLHVELIPGDQVVAPPELRSVLERADALRRAGPEGPRDLPPPRTRTLPPLDADAVPPLPPPTGDGGDDAETADGDR